MKRTSDGQALVVLLVFMVMAIIITTMAVALIIINATAASHVEQGDMALKLAESGAEDALLRLVRDPTYTGTQTLTLGSGTTTATVSGTNPIIITSEGVSGSFVRRITSTAQINETILTLVSWRETY